MPTPPEPPFSAFREILNWVDKPELSGSRSAPFTYGLYCQAVRSLCHNAQDDPETVAVARIAAQRALASIAPRDAVEGMMAAQLLGLHEAAIECLKRGAMAQQTFEGAAGEPRPSEQAGAVLRDLAGGAGRGGEAGEPT